MRWSTLSWCCLFCLYLAHLRCISSSLFLPHYLASELPWFLAFLLIFNFPTTLQSWGALDSVLSVFFFSLLCYCLWWFSPGSHRWGSCLQQPLPREEHQLGCTPAPPARSSPVAYQIASGTQEQWRILRWVTEFQKNIHAIIEPCRKSQKCQRGRKNELWKMVEVMEDFLLLSLNKLIFKKVMSRQSYYLKI